MKVLLTTLNAKYIHSSLALRCLKAYCQDRFPKTKIKEYTINNSLLDILADIFADKPDIIGFACYIWNIDMTLDLVELVRKVLPQTIIILGGPEVTYNPEDIMEKHCAVDYIIMGEGEEVFCRLLDALKKGGSVEGLCGLARRTEDGIRAAGIPRIVENLDDLPFVYDNGDILDLKDRIIYYESSRGCPFSCRYCLSGTAGGVRNRSLDLVIGELAFFVRHNVKQVKFVDRTFNACKSHYLPILKFLAEQDCRTNFHFEIAADILDAEALAVVRKAPQGRFQFEIGIQSTQQETLQAIHRKNNWSKIVENVGKLTALQNAHLHLDLIVGLPYEDMQRFGRSFNDVYALKPDMLQIGFLKLLKGSGMRVMTTAHGYVYMDKAPYEVLSNKYMSYHEIRKLKILENAFNQTYNSGRFRYTMPFLIKLSGGNAFYLFLSLAAFWEKRGFHMTAHSSKAVVRHIGEFCGKNWPDQLSLCEQLLKFDVLAHEHGLLFPEFLPWNNEQWGKEKSNFWRNEEVVRRYLPDYTFTSWRDIKKAHHLEVFDCDIVSYTTGYNTVLRKATPVLFNFKGTKPEFQPVASEDFWNLKG
jgi:radical SAM superfamily enzyme YgiQ (UPF0313 family)